MARLQSPAGLTGPCLAAIAREQLALVERVSRYACIDRWRPVFERGLGRGLENRDVDPHCQAREQCDRIGREHHRFAGAKHPPRDMDRLAQPRQCGIGLDAGPERIDQVLGMHSPVRLHRQHLHQRGRCARPEVRRQRNTVNRDAEAAEESYLDPHYESLLPPALITPGIGHDTAMSLGPG